VISCFDDPIADTIPLTAREKTLIAELEAIVERGLERFLAVGEALATIRNQRLYRTHYPTFEQYVRDRFGLARSSVDQLIRSSQTEQTLMDSGINLPSATPEAVIRPLSGLPGEDLQAACWNLVVSVAPERGPSQPLVSHLCRMVRDVLDGEEPVEDAPSSTGPHRHPRRRGNEPERETPFIRPIERLAAWNGFQVEVIVSGVQLCSVGTVWNACDVLAGRCRQVQERLETVHLELIQRHM
jgi:hypothetical protein